MFSRAFSRASFSPLFLALFLACSSIFVCHAPPSGRVLTILAEERPDSGAVLAPQIVRTRRTLYAIFPP